MTDLEHAAGEYALGLLEGEDLLAARVRLSRDPEFAAAVMFWESRLAPLADKVGGMAPDPALWPRIASEIDDRPGGEVVRLQQRVRFWQRMSAGAAIAAVAALALAFLALPSLRSSPVSVPATTAPAGEPLVASFDLGPDKPRIGVTVLPDRREMFVSTAGIASDGVHDHQLWLMPAGGRAVSIGVVKADSENHMTLPQDLVERLADGSKLAVSAEPIGGSRTGEPSGPVVATAQLESV